MTSRYQTISLRTSRHTRDQAFSEDAICYGDFRNPPIPKGYKHVLGEWDEGLVIENCIIGSQFVWVPVLSLEKDGMFANSRTLEQFGRRNYEKWKNFNSDFIELPSKILIRQYQSVMKMGGFFISRYDISKNARGKPVSVEGAIPWLNIDFNDARRVATNVATGKNISSHLTFASEHDSVLAWFIQSGAKKMEDITREGKISARETLQEEICPTGSKEEWCIKNIYDFGYNINEWTQENYSDSKNIIRGGYWQHKKFDYSAIHRYCSEPEKKWHDTGFRTVLLLD